MAILTDIRSRLMLLVAACVLSMYVFWFYNDLHSSEQKIREVQLNLRAEADASASNINQAIRGAASLLYTFRMIPQLRVHDSTAPCKVLAGLLALDSRYINNGYIIRPDGLITCFSKPVIARGSVAGHEYFRRALASGKVEVGKPTLCRNTGEYCFPMALALRNASGRVTSVLALDLDPIWISKRAALMWSEPQTSMVWWDIKSNVVFAWPNSKDLIGKSFAGDPISLRVFEKSTGYFSGRDIDGLNKVFGYSTIRGIGHPDLRLSLNVPRDFLLASVHIKKVRNRNFFAVILLFSLASAWLFGEFLIRRKLMGFSQMASRMGENDRRIKTKESYIGGYDRRRGYSEKNYSKDAFGMLAQSINALAKNCSEKITKARDSEHTMRVIAENLAEGVALSDLDGRLVFLNPTELGHSESRLRTVLEHINEGVILADPDGNLLYLNPAAMRLYGFTDSAQYHHNLSELTYTFELSSLNGTVWPVEQWPINRILKGEKLNNLEACIRHIQHDWKKIFSYNGTIIPKEDGETLMVVMTVRDITNQRDIEQKIQAQVKKAEMLLEASPDPIVIVDRAGKIVVINARTELFFGYSRMELIGKSIEILIPEQLRTQHARYRESYQKDPKTRAMGADLSRELIAMHKDGREIAVDVSLSPVDTPDGKLVVSTIRSMTKRRLVK